MKYKRQETNKYSIMKNTERLINEMRLVSKYKSELYELRVEMIEKELTMETKAEGENCIKKISACLEVLCDLYNCCVSSGVDFNDAVDTKIASQFVKKYISGIYDKMHSDMCEGFDVKIRHSGFIRVKND